MEKRRLREVAESQVQMAGSCDELAQRMYAGVDDVMEPVITDTEKQERREKIVTRRRSMKDARDSRCRRDDTGPIRRI